MRLGFGELWQVFGVGGEEVGGEGVGLGEGCDGAFGDEGLDEEVAVALQGGVDDGFDHGQAARERRDDTGGWGPDRDGAQVLQKELEALVHFRPASDWTVPVLATVAVAGDGVAALAQATRDHGAHLLAAGGAEAKRRERAIHRVRQVVDDRLERSVWADAQVQAILESGLDRLDQDHISPYSLAEDILAHLKIPID